MVKKICLICKKEFESFDRPNRQSKRPLRPVKAITCSKKCASMLVNGRYKDENNTHFNAGYQAGMNEGRKKIIICSVCNKKEALNFECNNCYLKGGNKEHERGRDERENEILEIIDKLLNDNEIRDTLSLEELKSAIQDKKEKQ